MAVLLAAGAAYATRSDVATVYRWGKPSAGPCQTGALLDETNCGTIDQGKGSCMVKLSNGAFVEAFDQSDCTVPLYTQY